MNTTDPTQDTEREELQLHEPEKAKEESLALEKAEEQPSQPPEEPSIIAQGSPAERFPVELDVAVPVSEFRVRHLLALQSGQVIETRWGNGQDLPLAARNVQLAWSEFEVLEAQLAVRLTRLV